MVLLDWLIKEFPAAKRTNLRRMIEDGRILINGMPARRAKDPVGAQDRVEVLDRESANPAASKTITLPPFEILHEDDDVIVILKPPGLLTSTGPRERRATAAKMLTDYLAKKRPKAHLGLIHRLDRDASGLLVFSLNPHSYYHLKRQFFHHTVDRVYTAVVDGAVSPPEGTIESELTERRDGKVARPRDDDKGAQMAITQYQTLARARLEPAAGAPPKGPVRPAPRQPGRTPRQMVSLLRVTLQTGRKHQIRAHFAGRRNPVLNDPIYGPDPEPRGRLLLAATRLAFDHPRTGERLQFEIKPPKEITRLFPEFFGLTPAATPLSTPADLPAPAKAPLQPSPISRPSPMPPPKHDRPRGPKRAGKPSPPKPPRNRPGDSR